MGANVSRYHDVPDLDVSDVSLDLVFPVGNGIAVKPRQPRSSPIRGVKSFQ